MVCQRVKTPRPRVQERQSTASEPNRRWSIDVVSFPCGEDGLGVLAVVMDNFNREVLGYEFALRGRAQEAVRALEEALLGRCGSLFVDVNGLVLRSDNGLIFQPKAFRAACHDQGVKQEFITPYMPQHMRGDRTILPFPEGRMRPVPRLCERC